jgi:Bacteriocin-protection, YdeI or OmpD-Associated/Domain of unknown function (DUF1905)
MRGEFLLGLSRAVRQKAGVEAGDKVDVNVDLDTAPREVEARAALAEALSEDSEARATFDQLAYTHRKEYARWIDEAKRDETCQTAPGESARDAATRQDWELSHKRSHSREVEAEPGCHGSHALSEDAQVLPPILVAGRQRLGGRTWETEHVLSRMLSPVPPRRR